MPLVFGWACRMIEVHFVDGDVECFELKDNISNSFEANKNTESYYICVSDGWIIIPQSFVKYIRYVEAGSE